MKQSVELDVMLHSPIEKVWTAITDSATLGKWMMFKTNNFQPTVGHMFQFRDAPGYDGVIDCEVKEVDEPNKLVYTWNTTGWDGQPHCTLVTITLSRAENGTALSLVQSGFKPEATQEFQGAQYAWSGMLDQLKAELDA